MADKPKMEFPTNVPQVVLIRKMFKVKEAPPANPEWGKSYCYDLQHNGVDKVYFAKDAFYNLAKEYPDGSTVTICWEEKKGEKGSYHQWKMTAALFDEEGRPPQPAPAPISHNGLPTDEYRQKRIDSYAIALEDAYAVMARFYEEHPKVEPKFEDIRAIAISMCIQFDRKS